MLANKWGASFLRPPLIVEFQVSNDPQSDLIHHTLGYPNRAKVYQNGQEGKKVAAPEVGLPSGVVKTSVGAGDSLNLALGLS